MVRRLPKWMVIVVAQSAVVLIVNSWGAQLVSVEPSSQPEATSGGSSFWTSLPGLITAISGLLTALVGVGALIYQIAGSDKDDAVAAGGNPPAATRTDSPKPATGPSSGAGGDGSLWSGTLLFGNNGIDFDAAPPNIKPGGGFDVYDAGDNKFSPGGGGAAVAAWKGSGTPTAADCDRLLSSEGLSNTDTVPKYYESARFCVRTNGAQKIVLVTFLGQKSGNNRIEATVWAPAG